MVKGILKKIVDKSYNILCRHYFFDPVISTQEILFDLGSNSENPLFYIIYRRNGGSGFFSNVLHVFRHIQIAKQLNLIPVVDFINYPTIYSLDDASKDNDSWQNYFEPISFYSLNEAYISKRFMLCDGYFPKAASMAYDIGNEAAFNLFSETIKVKSEILEEVEKRLVETGINLKKTIGEHWRGGEQNKAKGHLFGATKKQVFEQIDYLLSTSQYEQIFISTEVQNYFLAIKKRYGSLVQFNDNLRSNRNSYKYPVRPNHYYLLGREILVDALILSKCHALIHTNSNVSDYAIFLNHNQYKHRIEIYNGTNQNDYFSIIRYSYKKHLPYILGGLKNQINIYTNGTSK